MPSRRLNPNLVKLHRTYAVAELADRLAVHKNTVRQWQRDGLRPIDGGRPILFQGGAVRAFISERNASRKRPCPAGTLYCVSMPRAAHARWRHSRLPPHHGAVGQLACDLRNLRHAHAPPNEGRGRIGDPAGDRRADGGGVRTPNREASSLPQL